MSSQRLAALTLFLALPSLRADERFPGLRVVDGVLVPDHPLAGGREPSTGLERAFPAPPLRADNPTTPARADLGRLLFFDPLLSGDDSMSCAHCHHPDLGFSDGLPRSRGKGASGVGASRAGGVELARSAPTLWNALFNHRQFWDGRARDLEEQAIGPITHPHEMAEDPAALVRQLAAIPEYARLFEGAFGGGAEGAAVTFENVTRAIAAFERTLVSLDSRFDRYAAGDPSALSELERDGLKLFLSPKTRCAECHGLPGFADPEFKVVGVPDPPGGPRDEPNSAAERGRGGGPGGAFKVPTLRNVALTAPYMHNGTLATLEEVLDFYARGGGRGRGLDVPLQDDKIRTYELTAEERRQLVAFLGALTDLSALPRVPERVPSGLPVVARVASRVPSPAPAAAVGTQSPRTGTARIAVEVRPGESIQRAVDGAGRGATIRIHPGAYHESVLVVHHDVRLEGIVADGKRPLLDGRGQLADAVAALGHRFEVSGLEIRGYQGNGVVVHGARDVVFEDLVLADPGLYGVYPVSCDGVRVERCRVSGARDAGIYVGQSRRIVVRGNEVFGNVAGIEIENSSDALVEQNDVHDNTGGILVFVLPFNPSKEGRRTVVARNRVVRNNTPNFAAPGATVANVLAGSGIMVLAADETEVTGNEIAENGTYGVAVTSLGSLYPPGTRLDVDPTSDGTRVHANTYRENGRRPDVRLESLHRLPGRDLLWDGTGQRNVWDEPGASAFPERLPAPK